MCEQMHERLAKLLTTRARPDCVELITVQELTSLGLVVAIFAEETGKRSGRRSTGLELSLQSQTVLFAQSFHDQHRKSLEKSLEKETWRRCQTDLTGVVNRLNAVPSIRRAFLLEESSDEEEEEEEEDHEINQEEHVVNGVANGSSKTGKGGGNNRKKEGDSKGTFVVGRERFAVTEIVPTFLNVSLDIKIYH